MTTASPFICVECGAGNGAASGPCVKCGSKAFRGDRDKAAAGAAYHTVADTVGLVPNVRWKDNLYQALAVAVTTAIGALTGAVLGGMEGAVWGVVGGLFAGFVASGVVLMVVGWVRTAKRG